MAKNTDEAIMKATYQALCKHGYPATSISKIADEFDKSTSLLYYHYDDKENLLEALLRYLLDQIKKELTDFEYESPNTSLMTVIDRLFPTKMNDDLFQFHRALLEIRSQASHIEAYQRQFQQLDEFILSIFIFIIEDSIKQNKFQEVNPEQTAEFLYSAAHGAIERSVTLGDADILKQTRQTLKEYIRIRIRAD